MGDTTPSSRRSDVMNDLGTRTLDALGRGHVQHGLRGHPDLHQARSAAGTVGRAGGRADHHGGSAGVRDTHRDPDRDDLRVSRPEAEGQPLGEHRCSGDHHRVRGRRRVADRSLRVLRVRGGRVHGADRLVGLGAARRRSRGAAPPRWTDVPAHASGRHREGGRAQRVRLTGRPGAQGRRQAGRSRTTRCSCACAPPP